MNTKDQIYFLSDNIKYNENHPTLSGNNILYLLNKTNSKYFDKEKFYSIFELLSIFKLMCENYQFRISFQLQELCFKILIYYKDELIQKYINDILLMCDNYWVEYKQILFSEEFLYDLIRKDINNLIPNCIIKEDWKIVNRNIPDFIIEIDNIRYPVEVKKDCIDNAALRQIKRYMNVYKCNKGYLLGKEIKKDLLENEPKIIFIDISHLKNKYYPQE